jgi:ubiquinone biosynthesis protein
MRERTLPHGVDRLARYAELGTIIVRSGLWQGWRRGDLDDRGRSLRRALERAGGIYVKLGQFLSTRPDMIPGSVIDELRLLQQDAPPVPSGDVIRLFASELGRPPAAVLACFESRPVAAASVAQVHRARLGDGSPVAVKVQRPDIAERIARDLDILGRLAALLERHTDWARDQQLRAMVRGFAASVTEELDFRAEGDNLTAIAAAVARHDDIVVPAPLAALTRRRVLVMEWIEGRPLSSGAVVVDPARRRVLAGSLLRSFLDQIFDAGVFHADPHPGNIHLTRDGRIALLDCGAVGRLTPRQQAGLQAVLLAMATRNPALMADAVTHIARPPASALCAGHGAQRPGLADALEHLMVHHLRPGSPPDLALFVAFTEVLRRYRLVLEPVVLGAIRALATLQSTIELLSPDVDLLDEAVAHGEAFLAPAA